MISSIPKWVGNIFEKTLRPNATVVSICYITPQIKKIRFQANLSKMNFQIGYANVIRVSETEYRNYTVAFYDKEKEIMDFLFHLHGNGVGSQYINALKTGDTVYISPPRGRNEYDPKAKRQLIFGDETSLGLACSFLPVLKQNEHQFRFYFELNEENKQAPQLLGLENATIFPKNGSFRDEDWISHLPVFKTPEWQSAHYVLTGNAKSVQNFRKSIKNKTEAKIFSTGYWLEGKKGL